MNRKFFHNTKIGQESCILIGVVIKGGNRNITEENIEELADLANTAGACVKEKIIQERLILDPAYFIGKGKAVEIADQIKIHPVDMIIFDDELTPAQLRNWEQLTEIKVIDRSALILDIFAAHAKSREARTQVELAQLTYLLPRLTRQWLHLSRQVGGIGTKGPGETQLETDRRLVRTRIGHLKKDLARIERQGITQRKKAGNMIRASLVGYTNSGKSTLLNSLTGAGVPVEDKLFATLDTTTRRLKLNKNMVVLLSDTVGFIKKLPHHLIASFQTTLAQTREADLLIHVVDMSNRSFNDHIQVVEEILENLDISEKPTLMVFNKVDLVSDEMILQQVYQNYSQALFISAKKRIRLERIKSGMAKLISINS
jgi:GTP-binding protein HflX